MVARMRAASYLQKSMASFPQSLLQELETLSFFDKAAFLDAHQNPAPTSVRIHPVKGPALFADERSVPWCETGRYLEQRPVFTLDPLFHAGAYYVQEASSMFLDQLWRSLFEAQKNMRVLDLCGAPGGKSTLLASILDKDSLLISNDVIRSRASILEENAVRWGYTNHWVASNDPRDFGRSLTGYFDAMLVDAPCSGSGLFRKDANALEEWSEGNVALCNARQQRILADAWPALKEDGVLIYATCSYSIAEDEEILDWLGDTYDLSSVEVPVAAGWGIVPVRSPKHQLYGYRFFPDKVEGEGFFIAAVRKAEPAESFFYPRVRSLHHKKLEEAAGYLLRPGSFTFLENDRRETIAFNAQHTPDYALLSDCLYLRKAGVTLGSAGQKEWIPAHEAALSLDRSNALPMADLTRQEALQFLKKEDVALPADMRGWVLAAYEGRALGWMKVLSNRSNNYLPKSWRIRMSIDTEDSAR